MVQIVCDVSYISYQLLMFVFYQSGINYLSSDQPTNWIYVVLLALLNLFAVILWWLIRGFITDVKRSISNQEKMIHKLDRRLVRIETKMGLNDEDNGDDSFAL